MATKRGILKARLAFNLLIGPDRKVGSWSGKDLMLLISMATDALCIATTDVLPWEPRNVILKAKSGFLLENIIGHDATLLSE